MDGDRAPAKLAGNSAIYIFPLCVLFVFLSLGALRKLVVAARNHFDRPNVFVQFDLRCLAALDGEQHLYPDWVHCAGWTCLKNAILIVEFAKQIQDRDQKDRFTAAVEACRLRLRPIMTTSFAFIFAVVPLVVSSGAGAEMRQALGTAVFFGMLGVTGFGLFLTPVFYVVIMWFKERRVKMRVPAPTQSTPP